MPPTDRFVISFAAEPPQEGLPYGRWAETLKGHFLAAVREMDTEGGPGWATTGSDIVTASYPGAARAYRWRWTGLTGLPTRSAQARRTIRPGITTS